MWIDTHVHLNDKRLYASWKEIVNRAKEKRVNKFFVVGYDINSSRIAVELSENDDIYATIGLHPHESDKFEFNKKEWDKLLTSKVIAIGEIGLDYYKLYSLKDSQKQIFIQFIQYAKENKLPIVIHSRDAWKDLIDIMKTEKVWEIGGIMHSFSGSYEIAKIIADWNFLFSFSGPITYPNANNLRDVVRKLPLDLIAIETDAPYLPPQSIRGKINEPAYLPEIAQKISEIKGIDLIDLSDIIKKNLKRIFKNIAI